MERPQDGSGPGTDLAALLRRAAALAAGRDRAVLGIAGSPGAGKTTLAQTLVAALNAELPDGLGPGRVAHVPMDGYHLADVELTRLGRLDRKGAPDTFDVDGYAALLTRVRRERDVVVYAPAFERTLEQPVAGSIPVPPSTRLVVTEGNYLLLDRGRWGRVRQQLDEVWYCEVPADERRRRLVRRHTAFGKDEPHAVRWVAEVDEVNARLVESTSGAADLVVPPHVLGAS